MIASRLAMVAMVAGLSALPPDSAPARLSTVGDTVDVSVGSPLIDPRDMRPFATHLKIYGIANGTETLQQEATNTISLGDSAGRRLIVVTSAANSMTPSGQMSTTTQFAFDRGSLALVSMHVASPRGEASIRADGLTIEVSPPGPPGRQPIVLKLTRPAFYADWSDFIVEELPRHVGVVYRVPLWRPRMQPTGISLAEETHLYTIAGHEDVDVIGKSYKQAWVVEDRVAGQSAPAGRMWIIDGPPKLVRWITHGPNGPESRIDQGLADTNR
jgi:hypothetical protein